MKKRNNTPKSARRIKKATNTTTEQRSSKRKISSAAIGYIKDAVNRLKPVELSASCRNRTYQTMLLDDCVFAAFDYRAVAIERGQANGRFKYKKDSEASKALKDFLEYNMRMMNGQTSRSVGRTCAEMIPHGWAPHELVTHKQEGEYKDLFTIKNLAFIHPLSLDPVKPYQIAEGGDKIDHLRQASAAFIGSDGTFSGFKGKWAGYKEIDYRRIMSTAYSGTSSQPSGISAFDACYTAWREKQLLQDYLLIGVTRDFAGTPVLRIPSEIIEAAELDSASVEAQQLEALTQGMQLMHSGDATYMILPSDAQAENGTGLRDYDIDFKGVEGGGKNFDITVIIEQKKKAIHSVLATSHLISGENGGGSFNLHEGQSNTTALVAGRDNMIVDEMWNKQIIPKLLRLNGWEYKLEDLPVWKHGDIQPISYDEKGKYINRVARLLPAVPDVANAMLEDLDVDYRVPDDYTPDQVRELMFDFVEESKTGTGEGSSGTGSTNQNNSDTNSENK